MALWHITQKVILLVGLFLKGITRGGTQGSWLTYREELPNTHTHIHTLVTHTPTHSLFLIFQVDSENERCLVQFEDSTAHWSLYKDLTKLKLPESDDLCVICKSSKSWETNEIVLCHICEQGYHQDCMQVSGLPGDPTTGDNTQVK